MKIAYLINQYPKVSHSFIRREILALEAAGVAVSRFSVRGWQDQLADAEDVAEQGRTAYLLRSGTFGLLAGLLRQLVRHPGKLLRAAAVALRLSRQSDRSFLHHLAYLGEAAVLLAGLERDGVRHIHAHFGTNSATVALLAHLLGGVTFSVTVHGPEEFDKPLSIALTEKIRHASFVVAISSFGRSQLYRWADCLHWPKIKVVHCGLEARFGIGAAAACSQLSTHRLVCVGRLCEQKGQLLLLEAFASLRARGVEAELVLAGDGEMRELIEHRAFALGVASHLRVTGWISSEDVARELLAARALVLPSFAEGLPVVIMEAMAVGRPVISTYVAGIPELVQPGRTGWLVPAGDVSSLEDAMAACLSMSDSDSAAMGARARERVLARHQIDASAALLIRHFKAALAPMGA